MVETASADFYLININTTNAPQTPYGGLLNITTASVTQHELTGFMAGYEYNLSVCGVNCVNQRGSESDPLTITPQGKCMTAWAQRREDAITNCFLFLVKVAMGVVGMQCF